MDTLNEQYPIYPPNPYKDDLESFDITTSSDSSSSENESEECSIKKSNPDDNSIVQLNQEEGGHTGITITRELKRRNKRIKKRNEYYNQQRRHVENIIYINRSRKKKINILFDEWTTFYSDELWILWCIMTEFISESGLPFFDKINYMEFVRLCFRNSTKH